jgi:hypothetical protein
MACPCAGPSRHTECPGSLERSGFAGAAFTLAFAGDFPVSSQFRRHMPAPNAAWSVRLLSVPSWRGARAARSGATRWLVARFVPIRAPSGEIGGVRERPNRHDWKSCVGKLTMGSNPIPSAGAANPGFEPRVRSFFLCGAHSIPSAQRGCVHFKEMNHPSLSSARRSARLADITPGHSSRLQA